jgi:hypothetical protein
MKVLVAQLESESSQGVAPEPRRRAARIEPRRRAARTDTWQSEAESGYGSDRGANTPSAVVLWRYAM